MACFGLLFIEMWLLVRLSGDRRPFRNIFALDLPPPRPWKYTVSGESIGDGIIVPVEKEHNELGREWGLRVGEHVERLSQSLGAADDHLVSLLPEMEGMIVPSKSYGIAAAGHPAIL